jgi:hypothetical protein
MIQKNTLQSIISKYYLNGLVESVKWEIKDKKLTIQFMETVSRDMLGVVEFKKIDLENVNIAIFDTTQLNKLLSITSGDLIVKIVKQGIIANKLNISDAQFDVSYSLADINLIGKIASAKEPDKYEIIVDLNEEQQNALIKAKNAVGIEDDNVNISQSLSPDNESILSFIFGENTEHSNKVTYSIPIKQNVPGLNLSFKSNYIKEILSANKELEKCILSIYSEGLLKLSFSDKSGINSEYFLVSK